MNKESLSFSDLNKNCFECEAKNVKKFSQILRHNEFLVCYLGHSFVFRQGYP